MGSAPDRESAQRMRNWECRIRNAAEKRRRLQNLRRLAHRAFVLEEEPRLGSGILYAIRPADACASRDRRGYSSSNISVRLQSRGVLQDLAPQRRCREDAR